MLVTVLGKTCNLDMEDEVIKLHAHLWGFCFVLFPLLLFSHQWCCTSRKVSIQGFMRQMHFATCISVLNPGVSESGMAVQWNFWPQVIRLSPQAKAACADHRHSAQNQRQRCRDTQSIWGWLHGSASLRKTRQAERYQQRTNFFCPCYNFDGHTVSIQYQLTSTKFSLFFFFFKSQKQVRDWTIWKGTIVPRKKKKKKSSR